MNQSTWLSCMESLKKRHKEIARLISSKSIAYVDIPVHFNIGDLLIYKGTEAFFEQYNINVAYRAGTSSVNFEKIESVDVILLHGGGNFGDLYPIHQKLRERIIDKFKHKRIICLPQSIYFESKSTLTQSAALFSQHPDFHLCVRDDISFNIAKNFTNNVILMPDMAHSLHPLVDMREVGPSNIFPPKILNLIRIDKEHANIAESVNKEGFDWINIITTSDNLTLDLYNKMIKLPFLRKKATKLWNNLCDEVIFRSVNYFSSHTIIHTDRLHGLILSTLLGKKVFLKDNSYGKNTTYYKAWLKEYPYLELANEN